MSSNNIGLLVGQYQEAKNTVKEIQNLSQVMKGSMDESIKAYADASESLQKPLNSLSEDITTPMRKLGADLDTSLSTVKEGMAAPLTQLVATITIQTESQMNALLHIAELLATGFAIIDEKVMTDPNVDTGTTFEDDFKHIQDTFRASMEDMGDAVHFYNDVLQKVAADAAESAESFNDLEESLKTAEEGAKTRAALAAEEAQTLRDKISANVEAAKNADFTALHKALYQMIPAPEISDGDDPETLKILKPLEVFDEIVSSFRDLNMWSDVTEELTGVSESFSEIAKLMGFARKAYTQSKDKRREEEQMRGFGELVTKINNSLPQPPSRKERIVQGLQRFGASKAVQVGGAVMSGAKTAFRPFKMWNLAKNNKLLQKAGKGIKAAVGGLNPMGAMIGAIAAPLNAFINGVLAPFQILGNIMGSLGTVLGTAFVPIIMKIGEVLLKLMPLVSFIAEALQPFFDLLIAALDPIMMLIEPIMVLVEALLPPIVQIVTALLTPTMSMFQLLEPLMPLLMLVVDLVVLILNVLQPFIDTFSLMASKFSEVIGIIAGGIGGVTEIISGFFHGQFDTIQEFWAAIKNSISGFFQGVIDGIGAWWDDIVAKVRGFFQPLIDFIQNFNLVDWFKELIGR